MQLEMQRMQNEVRLEELRTKDQRDREGIDVKKETVLHQQKKEDSLKAHTKQYSEALKNVLPHMPDDLCETPSYYQLRKHLRFLWICKPNC